MLTFKYTQVHMIFESYGYFMFVDYCRFWGYNAMQQTKCCFLDKLIWNNKTKHQELYHGTMLK